MSDKLSEFKVANKYTFQGVLLRFANTNSIKNTTYWMSFIFFFSFSQLIYQQPFPTVQYEYSMPLNRYLAPEPGTPSAVLPLGE